MGSVFFSQPRKGASPENPCGKFTVFHILHRLFHRRFSTNPQACGEIHAVYIKDLQIDTLFFTFFETGHFDPPRRFVENYPLDSPGRTPLSRASRIPGPPTRRARPRERAYGPGAETFLGRNLRICRPEWQAEKFFQKRVDFRRDFRYNTGLYEILL